MPQDKIRTKAVEEMLQVLARMDSADAVYNLLQDLCTVREINDMAQRLQVARLLAQGTSYMDIQEATGASATTISRVSKCLNYGSGGYRSVIDADLDGDTQEAS